MTVLVPAHNEQEQIAKTIESILVQTCPPDEIVVVCDNCTDDTEVVANSFGVTVLRTAGNVAKKAGALNQALNQFIPSWHPDDAVLVMDADSALDGGFLETAVRRLAQDDVVAVGGTFFGQDGGGFVGMCQRNEYARYARDVARLKGKVLVLTGTAAVFRVSAFTEVIEARQLGRLPGGQPQVYDTHVLTEDNELTLALLHLGHHIVSPLGCRLTTEVMPTWGALARQRLRWKRGALENLTDYGLTRVTARYWGRQVMSLLGVVVTFVYLLSMVWAISVDRSVHVAVLWAIVSIIFIVERVVTVRSRGLAQMAIASVLVVEMIFDVFLQLVQARAFVEAGLHVERKW